MIWFWFFFLGGQLDGCSYVDTFPYSLHLLSSFGERAEFDVNINHIFPQEMLAAITLIGCGAGEGGARDRARVSSLLGALLPYPG